MEEFEKIWQEALDSYETIPDKSKIKEEDKKERGSRAPSFLVF